MYIIIADWDRVTNKITAENRAPNITQAKVMLKDMIEDGYSDAFFTELPDVYGSGWGYVDPVAKTVSFDKVKSDAAAAMSMWKENMRTTDKEMPRYLEDLIDDQNFALKPGRLKDNHTNKKVLRGQKP